MSKKSKLNDDTPSQVMLDGYKGHEDVPQNVTHVRFHHSVIEFDNEAFAEHTKLREVVLNDGLRVIGKFAFHLCTTLQRIVIPSTVTMIGSNAFYGCSELKEVVLNEGLQTIGDTVFHNCKALQCIAIPSTVDGIGRFAFKECSSLRDVVLDDGLKEIRHSAFIRCASLERITIPSTVTEIDEVSFYGCSRLREVTIANDEVHIDNQAFTGCTLLERFKFPSLSTRLNNVVQAGQRGIEAKMDDIPAVEWRSGELSIPAVRRENHQWGRVETVVKVDKEKLAKIISWISYYEIKEATTVFELALWKAKMNQAEEANANRNILRVYVPGPVKDTILQFLQ